MSLKCKWVTGSQQPSRTTCRRLWSSRSYLSFWKRPTPSIAHDGNFGRKQPDLPSLSARTCAAKWQREGICLTGSRARSNSFRFQKKNEPRQDCSSTLWLFELCRPSQFAQTATVLNFTRSFLHLGPPAVADSPAAPGWAGEVLHRSILTDKSTFFRMFKRRFVQVFRHSNSLPLTKVSNLRTFVWALVHRQKFLKVQTNLAGDRQTHLHRIWKVTIFCTRPAVSFIFQKCRRNRNTAPSPLTILYLWTWSDFIFLVFLKLTDDVVDRACRRSWPSQKWTSLGVFKAVTTTKYKPQSLR